MFFSKKKYELTDEDARSYIELFEKNTTSLFMDLKSKTSLSHGENMVDDGALFDALEILHQAIVREQLIRLSNKFYGGEAVIKQINDHLAEYEVTRLGDFTGDVRARVMIQDIETMTAKLASSEVDGRYTDALISQLPSISSLVNKSDLEIAAADLRDKAMSFWQKNNYCK